MKFQYYPITAETPLLQKGRVTITEEGLLMDWSACGMSLRFRGSGITFTFRPFHDAQPVYVMAELDGMQTKFAVTNGSEMLSLACADGEHEVTFLRLSEGGVPLICDVIRVTSENGQEAPVLLPPPAEKERRIVFFGDSITCGYGDLADPAGTVFRTCEEDPTRAYACRTAALLDAEAELVSISGQGIVLNCAGEVGIRIPVFYAWQSRCLMTPHDFSRRADVVVVNAGTNDAGGGVALGEFHDGALAFVRALRTHYPQAEIIWFYGLMGLQYDPVLAQIAEELKEDDPHFTYLPVASIWEREGEIGVHGHPSVEGAARGADVLSQKIRELMHW